MLVAVFAQEDEGRDFGWFTFFPGPHTRHKPTREAVLARGVERKDGLVQLDLNPALVIQNVLVAFLDTLWLVEDLDRIAGFVGRLQLMTETAILKGPVTFHDTPMPRDEVRNFIDRRARQRPNCAVVAVQGFGVLPAGNRERLGLPGQLDVNRGINLFRLTGVSVCLPHGSVAPLEKAFKDESGPARLRGGG